MEFCGAGSVNDLQEKLPNSIFNEQQIGAILRESLSGLVYLHKNKIIHRDLKAANILVNETGVCKLADFGVSAKQQSESNTTVTGTPLWMAPEILQSQPYNTSCDIWSLGITAIELAEGKPPFSEENLYGAIDKIVKSPPPTLQDLSKYSPQFVAFITTCLKKEPTQRPTAEELLNENPFIKRVKENNTEVADILKKIGKYRESGFENGHESPSATGNNGVNSGSNSGPNSTGAEKVPPSQETISISGPMNLKSNKDKEDKPKKKKSKKNALDKSSGAKEVPGPSETVHGSKLIPQTTNYEVPTSTTADLKKLSVDELINRIKLLEAQNRALVQGKQQSDATIKLLLSGKGK